MSEQPTPSGPAEREPGYLRIGELARRTGTSPELLRAWERRYGLLRPTRSQGGYRLYTGADEARIRRMRAYLARGGPGRRAGAGVAPDLIVLAATVPGPLAAHADALAALAGGTLVALGGAGGAAE